MGRPWYEQGLEEGEKCEETTSANRAKIANKRAHGKRQRPAPWNFGHIFKVKFDSASKTKVDKVSIESNREKNARCKEISVEDSLIDQLKISKSVTNNAITITKFKLEEQLVDDLPSNSIIQSELVVGAAHNIISSASQAPSIVDERALSRNIEQDVDIASVMTKSKSLAAVDEKMEVLRRMYSRNMENQSMRSGFKLGFTNVDIEGSTVQDIDDAPPKFVPAYFDYQRKKYREQARRRRYKWEQIFFGVYRRRNSLGSVVEVDEELLSV